MRGRAVMAVVMLVALAGAGCHQTDRKQDRAKAVAKSREAEAAKAATEPDKAAPDPDKARPFELEAVEFGFKAPDTVRAGLVRVDYVNKGAEPHFAAFARLNDGQTFDDAQALLTGPPPEGPPGAPPFVNVAGMPTADPGLGGQMTFNLTEGEYVLYCMIPSPDGVPHAAKGMMRPLEVTAGEPGALPVAPAGRLTVDDFTIGGLGIVGPKLEPGENFVSVYNSGGQFHEVQLVELAEGKTVDDVVAWAATAAGPPPGRFLSGGTAAPEEAAVFRMNLGRGKRYAFICLVPDILGDGAPHTAKGMYTGEWTVS